MKKMTTKERLTDNVYHTKENKERACYIQEPRLQAIYDKLFEIEDIEEELGVDLLTLLKALKDGVWVKYSPTIIEHKTWYVHLLDNCIGWKENSGSLYDNDRVENRPLKDYGKTWALTKEELL